MPTLLQRMLSASPAPLPIASEIVSFSLRDGSEIAVQRVRHPRARRIKLSVSERGVRLTLPMRASMRAADAFLQDHRDWIAAQWTRWQTPRELAPFGRDTTSIPLRGETIPLAWREGRYLDVQREPAGIVMQLPARTEVAAAQRALREFYRVEAHADVARWLPTYLPNLPRQPSTVRIRPLASLWGSLSARDALSLDLSLVLGEPAAFEYVLVHELCHLIHRNHQRAFWREVEARGADWRGQRTYLNRDGGALKSTLRRLITA